MRCLKSVLSNKRSICSVCLGHCKTQWAGNSGLTKSLAEEYSSGKYDDLTKYLGNDQRVSIYFSMKRPLSLLILMVHKRSN